MFGIQLANHIDWLVEEEKKTANQSTAYLIEYTITSPFNKYN